MTMSTTTMTIAAIIGCFLLVQQGFADGSEIPTKKTTKRSTHDNSLNILNIPLYSLAQKLRGEQSNWVKQQMADNEKLFASAGQRDISPALLEALSTEKRALGGSSLNVPLMALQGKITKQLQNQKARNEDLFKILGKK